MNKSYRILFHSSANAVAVDYPPCTLTSTPTCSGHSGTALYDTYLVFQVKGIWMCIHLMPHLECLAENLLIAWCCTPNPLSVRHINIPCITALQDEIATRLCASSFAFASSIPCSHLIEPMLLLLFP